jgi:hypothetical protein
MTKDSSGEEGFILEFHRVGGVVKVTAVDPQTGAEATIVGDPRAGQAALARAAGQKLRYVLERRAGAAKPRPAGGTRGGGQLV